MKMTFDDIKRANEQIRTTNIKGKEYAEVNQRIKAFRMVYPEGIIRTRMIPSKDGVCIIKAYIYAEKGVLLATGHAYEKEGSSFINENSYIENCETSAVGRALGMVGFGIDTSVCSADELGNALLQQEASKPITKGQVKSLIALAETVGSDLDEICKYFEVAKIEDLTAKKYGECLNILNQKGNKQ